MGTVRVNSAARAERTWRPGRPVPLPTIVGTLRRGPGDPAFRHDRGSVWRALRTPDGPAAAHLVEHPALGEVVAVAWGPGRAWTLDHVPTMLGAGDLTADEFAQVHAARHPFIARALGLHPHYRVQRSGAVFEALLGAALEQKVTGQEARTGWRRLLQRFGDPAPGPAAALGLMVPPDPHVVRRIPSWEWLRLPVDQARSRVAVTAARVAASLERTLDLPGPEADRRLRTLPGIGVWTAAEVRQRAHGDPDAASFGDYHVPALIGCTLVGQPVDDDGMAELLEPYRGHRFRVQRLAELCGSRMPRRGPRMAPRRHLPGRVG
ncbi:MAG: DNA-3-methyladenine glycosylase 2 family protein [Nocardioidaceae bacterium]|nr:DNA-3-methyladenine glycosylase 2 family protein [Nocardioidaceae bacterium]